MHEAPLCVSPGTSIGATAQLLVEQEINSVPVVEYEQGEKTNVLLVGLVTRSASAFDDAWHSCPGKNRT